MSRSNFENIKTVMGNLRDNPLFNELARECHGYLKRDGKMNTEYVLNSYGEPQQNHDDLPNERWIKSEIDKDNQTSFIQTSSLGRQRKISKIPYYQAVQRAIDIWRKNYKTTDLFSDIGSKRDRGAGQSDRNEEVDEFYNQIEDKKMINSDELVSFNDLVSKMIKNCMIEDRDSKSSNRGRYKSLAPKNNLLKTFCLILRRYGLELHLNDSLKRTVLECIGEVEVGNDHDCYIILGYDQLYNLKASNGSCARFTRDSQKIRSILKNYI